MKEGKYDNTTAIRSCGDDPKGLPWSYDKKGMPYYCIHSFVMNDIFKKVGVPVETKYGFQYDPTGIPSMTPAPTPSTEGKGKPMKFPVSRPIELTGKVALVSGEPGDRQTTCLALSGKGRISWSAMFFRWRDRRQGSKAGPEGRGLECDVSSPDQIRQAVHRTLKEFGKVDILVNNAGVMGKTGLPLEKITAGLGFSPEHQPEGNLLLLPGCLAHYDQAGWGKIVCVGSIAGKIGGVLAGPDYCASKGGIHALVKCLAKRGLP